LLLKKAGETSMTHKITIEGFVAARNCLNKADNPYKTGTSEHNLWDIGWKRYWCM
jgi:hypothetical protein